MPTLGAARLDRRGASHGDAPVAAICYTAHSWLYVVISTYSILIRAVK
jgi:hypothetical protein